MKRILAVVAVVFSFGGISAARADLVPPGCTVEDWCLKKATECFVGYVTNPQGLYRAHSQYSVVRRITAICESYYNGRERRVITGPVEPVSFSSGVESSEGRARAAALQLCERYREDWVSAAPACD
ncbi:MAG: hypothetical protein A2X94_00005 [Bdellovibrionales bacterium GWB1_55_8]|nr:MAG: hypothetical protein A2X94_00005 [Bdellovibrionales bacterium GWB1_55_8]